MLSSVIQDARLAIRGLIKQPTYALTVIGLLTIGIAGNTAVFCVFNGLFLRPLPFAEPEHLVNIDESAPSWNLDFTGVNYIDFVDWREYNSTFEAMAVYRQREANLTTDSEPVRIHGARVTHDLGDVLGIQPVLGRFFTEQEDLPGAEPVAMLGYALWRGRYGADPQIVGRSITLEGIPSTVVGVLPEEAEFIEAELWVPLALDPEQRRGSWWLTGIGRLKPGVTLEQAREDLTRIHKNAIDERSVNEITTPVVLPILERILGSYRLGTTAMLGAVGMVLLIACINIAGIMLARSLTRTREVAIRLALGAGRRRLIQQHLTESLVLSTVGAILGAALGMVATSSALRSMPAEGPPSWVEFGFDARVLGFVMLLSVGAAFAFGIVPALGAARSNGSGALQANATRISATMAERRLLDLLVTGEIALSVILLVAAGLIVRDFDRLRNVDPGYAPENVLMYEVSLPEVAYPDQQSQLAFFESHVERIRAIPGVTAAAAIDFPPMQGHNGFIFQIEDAPVDDPNAPRPVTSVRVASTDYIETMGIELLMGRTFLPEDGRDDGASVAIVNQTFANRYWPDESPIGKRIRPGAQFQWQTIIGVTRDVKHYGLDAEMLQGVYWPLPQAARSSSAIVLRSSIPPTDLVPQARRVLQEMDPSLPMANVATMSTELEESLWVRKGTARLSATFSIVALLLAVGGIYGVVSYRVNQRTKEIGIQMALGARPGQVLGQVLRHGALVIGLGVVLGLVGSYGAGKVLASVLVDGDPRDPMVYAIVVGILVAATLAANLLPARRAASVQPAEVLRGE